MTAELIEKEAIDVTKIIPADTKLSEELINRLASAPRLGNEFKAKATIEFNTTEGPKRVYTTVWSVTEKYIQLKNNIHIPIKCVIDIEF
ncbi:hypothetical protein FA048_15485 [Pedobacter polaris]|uniref:Uncharacterized protein n=1 Tax=Pedobacter polaris TaxID=2571273 RepID=A0A4U1CIB7_9SPHI|nr:hypothetical protein [Pedobacter polaris]TKC06607.1 hypothetical protein FA048_15485 [Pedobacter polaris]